jgi:hypothetical protein
MSIKYILGNPLDLTIIEKNFPLSVLQEMFPNATILGYGWRNLSEQPTDDNIGIRAEGIPDATDTLGADLKRDGWNSTKCPPIEDENGDLVDGRTRDKTMRFLGEKWMPVIKIKLHESETPNTKRRATAISLNKHPYHKRCDSNDFIAALVCDINDNEVARNKDALLEHLVNNYEIHSFFDNSNGTITKIVNNAYDETDASSAVVRNKDRDDWIQWLHLDTGIAIRDGEIAFLQVGGSRDEQFFNRWVIPQGIKGKKAKVILYVGTTFESKAKEQIKDFVKNVTKLYNDMFKVVSNTVDGINISPPKSDVPFELVGIIPQIQNELQMQKYEDKELVSLEEYLNYDSIILQLAS